MQERRGEDSFIQDAQYSDEVIKRPLLVVPGIDHSPIVFGTLGVLQKVC